MCHQLTMCIRRDESLLGVLRYLNSNLLKVDTTAILDESEREGRSKTDNCESHLWRRSFATGIELDHNN